MTPQDAIAEAIQMFGSEIALARAIGYTAPAVRRARDKGRPSAEMACNIEVVTNGRITRLALRPDIFGPTVKLIDNSWNRARPARGVGRHAKKGF